MPVLSGPVVAILLGLVVGQLAGQRETWTPGVTFASKQVLQTSIVIVVYNVLAAVFFPRTGPACGRPVALGGLLWLLVASSSLGLQWVSGTL